MGPLMVFGLFLQIRPEGFEGSLIIGIEGFGHRLNVKGVVVPGWIVSGGMPNNSG